MCWYSGICRADIRVWLHEVHSGARNGIAHTEPGAAGRPPERNHPECGDAARGSFFSACWWHPRCWLYRSSASRECCAERRLPVMGTIFISLTRTRSTGEALAQRGIIRSMVDGLAYIYTNRMISIFILLVAFHCALVMSNDSILPVFSRMNWGPWTGPSWVTWSWDSARVADWHGDHGGGKRRQAQRAVADVDRYHQRPDAHSAGL